MSAEIEKLRRTIDSMKKMQEAARAESAAAEISPETPPLSETGSPSPTSERSPHKSSA